MFFLNALLQFLTQEFTYMLRLLRSVALAPVLLVAMAVPIAAEGQSRPCKTASTLAQARVNALTGILTSTNPNYVAYAQTMGLGGLSTSDIVVESDSLVCVAVTDAVQAFTGTGAAPWNYLVLRAGSRFIALDPAGASSLVFSVSAAYNDVRMSLQ